MTFSDGWVCRACWLANRPRDEVCYRCKTPRGADDAQIEAQRKAAEERAAQPEAVPDVVVALPAVVFRVYARVWIRGGLIVFGFMAGEVSDGMRDREPWAFVMGLIMSVVAAIGSVLAFSVFTP